MGFNKRYVRKEMILDDPSNVSYIANLVNADGLIIDNWSDKFFKNFNFKWKTYNKMRIKILEENKFSSNLDINKKHIDYNKLLNLSNVLLNLKTNPSWLDIQLTDDILSKEVPEDISGKFDSLVDFSIKSIEEHFSSTYKSL
jgi:hypothetical protein